MNDKKCNYIVGIVMSSIITLIFFVYTAFHCIRYRDVFEGDYPDVYFAIVICIIGVILLTINILNISKINSETNPGVRERNIILSAKPDDKFSEIVKYKELLDKEIISKGEFEVKKKQLLGL